MTPKELAEIEGKPIALAWIDAGMEALRQYGAEFAGRKAGPATELLSSALAVNFSLPRRPALVHLPFVVLVLGTLMRTRDVIVDSARYFASVSEEEAGRIFRPEQLPPAYAIFEQGVYFTPRFAPYDRTTGSGFGPRCRAAMVVHESVHVVDRVSGEPANHISEWDEPGFSRQTPEESLHNPSSYASFVAQVHAGEVSWPREARFGAGRAAD